MNYKHSKHNYNGDYKRCSKCNREKKRSIENFHKASITKDGFAYICKECKKTIDKQSRKTNAKNIKAYQQTPKFIYSQLMYQAKKRGIYFDLLFNDYMEIIKDKCFYCKGETKNWIDRYINSYKIGYTKKNAVSCCENCNKMKRNKTHKDFINHCKKIAKANS